MLILFTKLFIGSSMFHCWIYMHSSPTIPSEGFRKNRKNGERRIRFIVYFGHFSSSATQGHSKIRSLFNNSVSFAQFFKNCSKKRLQRDCNEILKILGFRTRTKFPEFILRSRRRRATLRSEETRPVSWNLQRRSLRFISCLFVFFFLQYFEHCRILQAWIYFILK